VVSLTLLNIGTQSPTLGSSNSSRIRSALGFHDPLDQDVGIARPRAVIALGVRPERFSRLPLMVRLAVAIIRSLG
jgi:hypothetical protein